jgi:group II intron reverse transcriptase/maturase
MRNAETILGIIRDRGRRGLPLEEVYRQLFNRELYLLAYSRIGRNQGAMTPGTTPETVDGMSLEGIETIIEAIRFERYAWRPARRVYIEKKNSTKKRPLGIPVWSDKLVQEVIRLILEAYYEPQFSDHSHGFRPNRGCHTALTTIRKTWRATVWFIEGDISKCFDTLDHDILMSILGEKIKDNRFLRLIHNLLKAGYMEEWKYNETYSGTPQGGVVSPILANIYLDRLDKYVERELLPAHNRGGRRENNPEYDKLRRKLTQKDIRTDKEATKRIYQEMRRMPSVEEDDPGYRRLKYVRYADDFLLGFTGPRKETEEIKRKIGEHLRDELHLQLSEDKTLITHGRSEAARFLGYEIVVLHDDTKHANNRRSINGKIGLKVPKNAVQEKSKPYRKNGEPIHRTELLNNSVFTIIQDHQQIYRGIAEYYALAYNLHQLGSLKWVMETSMTKTLASKLKISVSEVYRRYGTTLQQGDQTYKVLQVKVEREGKGPLVAYWGGIPLRWKKKAVLTDRIERRWNSRTEVVQRLLADTCELCGSHEKIQVHHIRALKDLKKQGRNDPPIWVETMASRHRKTLIVCEKCHRAIHDGKLQRHTATE